MLNFSRPKKLLMMRVYPHLPLSLASPPPNQKTIDKLEKTQNLLVSVGTPSLGNTNTTYSACIYHQRRVVILAAD